MKDRDWLMLSLQLVMKASREREERERAHATFLDLCFLDLPKALEMIQDRLRKKEEVRVDSLGPLVAVVLCFGRPAVLYGQLV
jgi:hypothetical protein